MSDIPKEELDRATGEGMPEATVNVRVDLDPEVAEALREFNRTTEFGRGARGRFIRNDATQVQLIQELGRAVVLLAAGDRDQATDIALAVMSAADQADAGQRKAAEENEDGS